MNLVKELKPFNDILDTWKKGQTIRNPEAIEKLADIWLKFGQENAGEIYGRTDHKVPRVDTDCRSCINDMFDFLYNWRAIELRNPDNGAYHKFPKAKKGVVTITPNKKSPKKEVKKTGLAALSWVELKALAKEKEIKVHGKKRPILEAELEAL